MNNEERLAAFERMLRAIQTNLDTATERMRQLKAEGKEKSATFRQYMGNKLMCQSMLALYKTYGLLDGDEK